MVGAEAAPVRRWGGCSSAVGLAEKIVTSENGAGRMRRTLVTRFQLPILLGVLLLAACASQQLSPEERRAMELQTYCDGRAKDASAKHVTQEEQGQMDEVGKDEQTWEDATEGSGPAKSYDAAYTECMKKNAPD